MKKIKVLLLGSTGSIGKQVIKILKNDKNFKIVFLSAKNNSKLLYEQAKELNVKNFVSLKDIKNPTTSTSETLLNKKLKEVAKEYEYDILVNALVGISGLAPTYEAIKRGKDIALANKETLVTGGTLLTNIAKKTGSRIVPIDSEHSAIFQCLLGNENEEIKKIILTASGGPFLNKKISTLRKVTLKDALKHPNWSMGKKITIDSATLMNKGFEVIEAFHLFNVPKNKIEVIVHKESIIHSLVEFKDNCILAQLGSPSMLSPISFALNYLKRKALSSPKTEIRKDTFSKTLNLANQKNLSFEAPDIKTFKCLSFAFKSLEKKNSYAVALNAANEALVSLFLDNKIKFLDIQNNIEEILKTLPDRNLKTIDEILKYDQKIKETVLKKFEK